MMTTSSSSMIRNDDNDHLATRGRTLIGCANVLNLGDRPRVNPGNAAGGAQQMPRLRGRMNYNPGHPKGLSLLVTKCAPLCFREIVCRGFKAAMDLHPKMSNDLCICGTPLRWIQNAIRENQLHITQLHSLYKLYCRHGVHDHVLEFFLLDVILHCAPPQQGEGVAPLAEQDRVSVANDACVYYTDSHHQDGKDYEYCAVLAFLASRCWPCIATASDARRRRVWRLCLYS